MSDLRDLGDRVRRQLPEPLDCDQLLAEIQAHRARLEAQLARLEAMARLVAELAKLEQAP